jgi:hypothetical protein
MTERAVELALTDHWLHLVRAPERVVEVGAVTPYYWPRRVSQVVDPCDLHPLVTHRVSVFDVDLTERPVISISTFEHIGAGDYKLAADPPLVSKAFRKLFRESPNFLITVPVGFNEFLDDLLFGTAMPRDGVEIHFIIRSPTANDWKESDPAGARLPYPRDAKGQDRWANSLAIVSRGQFC